jgi:succinate dehydrogenase / fumarate reductase cytochrome b subunit
MAEANSRPISPAARRPLSPHLQVYRMIFTMVMSGFHRITGMGLAIGTLLLAWWLAAAASDAQSFAVVSAFMTSIIGQLILFGYTWALIHHMLGGIRHLIWDTGHGMDDPEREYLAQATLIGGIVLTLLIWIIAYIVR